MIKLRDYQQDMIDRARQAMRRHKRVLMQAPTGAGKTALLASMFGTAASRGKRAYFNVHRSELIDQASGAFRDQGIAHGVVAAGHSFQPHLPIQVCSIDTLRRRLEAMPAPDLMGWDECHHIAAKSWGYVQEHFLESWHIGLTATPCRLDGRGLDAHFDAMVKGPSVAWLIEQGFLCDYRVFCPGGKLPDLSAIKTTAGDYNRGQLADLLDNDEILGDVVAHYKDLAMGARAVAFCVSVKHAEDLARQFNANGIPADTVDGTLDKLERRRRIQAFREDRTKVLCNVDLIGEGFDLPALEVAILCRPTQSVALHLQQVGRALRPAPGKGEALILDHAGNTLRHGLPDDDRDWTLEGRKAKAKERGESDAPVTLCDSCFAVYPIGRRHCPSCGVVREVQAREIKQVEGKLRELDRAAVEERRRRAYEQASAASLEELTKLGYDRGYQSPERWAAKVYTGRLIKDRRKSA